MFDKAEQHADQMIVPDTYPRELEREVALKNGETLRIRPIRPDDESRLATLYDRLSRHTAYQRFFTLRRRLPADWFYYFANVDYRRRLALFPGRGPPGERSNLGDARQGGRRCLATGMVRCRRCARGRRPLVSTARRPGAGAREGLPR
jgi:hypothetical protein